MSRAVDLIPSFVPGQLAEHCPLEQCGSLSMAVAHLDFSGARNTSATLRPPWGCVYPLAKTAGRHSKLGRRLHAFVRASGAPWFRSYCRLLLLLLLLWRGEGRIGKVLPGSPPSISPFCVSDAPLSCPLSVTLLG